MEEKAILLNNIVTADANVCGKCFGIIFCHFLLFLTPSQIQYHTGIHMLYSRQSLISFVNFFVLNSLLENQ